MSLSQCLDTGPQRIGPTGTHAALPASPAPPIHDRSKVVFPLPGGADTTITRADAPSRPNSPPPTLPRIEPSGLTSIFAPVRRGTEPLLRTTVAATMDRRFESASAISRQSVGFSCEFVKS